MSNLNSIVSTSPMTQKGGRGYHHKKSCKCPLCKKGGADPDTETNYDSQLDLMEQGNTDKFANDDEYDDLDDMESGKGTGKGPGDYQAGGSRRRKRRTSKKSRKGGKRTMRKHKKTTKRRRKTRRNRY